MACIKCISIGACFTIRTSNLVENTTMPAFTLFDSLLRIAVTELFRIQSFNFFPHYIWGAIQAL